MHLQSRLPYFGKVGAMVPVAVMVLVAVGALLLVPFCLAMGVMVQAAKYSPLTRKVPKREWIGAVIVMPLVGVYLVAVAWVVTARYVPWSSEITFILLNVLITLIVIGGLAVVMLYVWRYIAPHAAFDGVVCGPREVVWTVARYVEGRPAVMPVVSARSRQIIIALGEQRHTMDLRPGVKSRPILGILTANYLGAVDTVTFVQQENRVVVRLSSPDAVRIT